VTGIQSAARNTSARRRLVGFSERVKTRGETREGVKPEGYDVPGRYNRVGTLSTKEGLPLVGRGEHHEGITRKERRTKAKRCWFRNTRETTNAT